MAYLKQGPSGLEMTYRAKQRPSAASNSKGWPARNAILLWFIASGLVWLALVASAIAFA